jgi:hypothetical protein
MTSLLQDIRYAVRTLRRSAGLTFVIVASLGIGIGANTAIFSVVNALLLKPLPYPAPERLAVLWLRSPGIDIPQDWPSPGPLPVSSRCWARSRFTAVCCGRMRTRRGSPPS